MSESKPPEHRDRTPVYLALIAAGATVLAALIGILPNLLNRSNPAPPVVITVPAPPTAIAQASAMLPPPSLTPSAPTATSAPTETRPPSPTPDARVTLLLVNNLPRPMEFFVDGISVQTINGGAYHPLQLAAGAREFKQCVVGSDYSDPANCLTKRFQLDANPELWEMFDHNRPPRAQKDVVLLVLNRAPTPQDIFIDGALAETVAAGAYAALTVSLGEHTLQPCFVGQVPTSGTCGARHDLDLTKPTDAFIINP